MRYIISRFGHVDVPSTKTAILAALLVPLTAYAEPPPRQYQPTTLVLLDQAMNCEAIATGQQAKIADLTKQVADLTKERDDLKAAAKPTEPPK
jgi:hypothetical protein